MMSQFLLLFLRVGLLTCGQLIGSPSDAPPPCVGPSEKLPVVQPDPMEMLLSGVPLLITQEPDLEK